MQGKRTLCSGEAMEQRIRKLEEENSKLREELTRLKSAIAAPPQDMDDGDCEPLLPCRDRCANSKICLCEKERLFREIHHRIRNNLQTVSSLLNIEARQSEDLQHRNSYQKSHNRIKSIEIVQEHLYRSRTNDCMDFRGYLNDMMQVLLRLYGREDIICTIEAEEIMIPERIAVPLSLIINEIITNSLTHAFRDGKGGKVTVSLRSRGGSRAELIIRDNGRGFPDEPGGPTSIGLEVVRDLADRIGGDMAMVHQEGTEFRLLFSSDHPA